MVLAASSKYFTAALGPNFKEANKSEFVLDDTDGETVKAIVDFCYTGHINLTEENVEKFLTIASSIQIDLLEEKCCQFYNDKLGVNNCVNTLIVADKYSAPNLRQTAIDMVCKSFEEIPSADIQRLDHRLLKEILKCDKIQANEELVYQRLLEWFHCEDGEHVQQMPELLKLIRLKHIPLQVRIDTHFYKSTFENSQFYPSFHFTYIYRFSMKQLKQHIRDLIAMTT